uniref:TGF-beta family profile domain-containing protein n=2 Tax=Leptobrachium leishanense TaxID=445787 RepID=A0A8C5Q893_9ANUR
MPWGGSERQQPACKRRQVSKAHGVHIAQRLLWSVQSVAVEFLVGALGRIYAKSSYYGALELDIDWVCPLEMLRFGQGEHAVTLCHWQDRQTRVFQGVDRNQTDPGLGNWRDTLNASGVQCPEWMRHPDTCTARGSRLVETFPGICFPKLRHLSDTSRTTTRNTGKKNNRINLFMGRGSSCVTTPPWSCKITLWIIIASLLFLSAMITGSPVPRMNMETRTRREMQFDPLWSDSSDITELTPGEDMDIMATQSSHYDNTTILKPIGDELADRLPRSVRATAESVKPKKSKKKSTAESVKPKKSKKKSTAESVKPKKSKMSSSKGGEDKQSCSLRTKKMKVSDLGLGYESDELFLFGYCSGTCQETRNEYDITLEHLLDQKKLSHSSHGPISISNLPCCRPTRFHNIVFMDVKYNWRSATKLSAAECECVG